MALMKMERKKRRRKEGRKKKKGKIRDDKKEGK